MSPSHAPTVTPPAQQQCATINAVVTMLPVSDVERSAEFYRMLGFEIGNRVPHEGAPHWVWLYQPRAENWKTAANLMLVRSSKPVSPNAQMPFYFYAHDLAALRNELLARGAGVGEIEFPEYLPKGECRVLDPDGSVLMLAQSYARSP